MELPVEVHQCIRALERAGFATYAVGGCVRDSVLGLCPQDYDLCTSALPEQIKSVFSQSKLVLSGEKHGTVGVVTESGVIEITTFRTEGDYQDNRHPGWVRFVPDIRQDLARRDFTVNAMAYSPTRGFQDPFGGQEDLNNHVLRTVGLPELRFQEDSLRILRGMRFSVRYQLRPDAKTESAMFHMVSELEHLAKERIFEELCKFIVLVNADDLRRFAPILGAVIPELADTFRFQQHTPYHAYDVYEHSIRVTAAVPGMLSLRWAALFHDLGKVPTFQMDQNQQGHFKNHASVGAEMADTILRRLKAPARLREDVVFLVLRHMDSLPPDRKLLCHRINQYGFKRISELLLLKKADFYSKGTGVETTVFQEVQVLLDQILAEKSCLTRNDLQINGVDLRNLGFSAGPELGNCLKILLEQVIDEKIPNDRNILLQSAAKVLQQMSQSKIPNK